MGEHGEVHVKIIGNPEDRRNIDFYSWLESNDKPKRYMGVLVNS